MSLQPDVIDGMLYDLAEARTDVAQLQWGPFVSSPQDFKFGYGEAILDAAEAISEDPEMQDHIPDQQERSEFILKTLISRIAGSYYRKTSE